MFSSGWQRHTQAIWKALTWHCCVYCVAVPYNAENGIIKLTPGETKTTKSNFNKIKCWSQPSLLYLLVICSSAHHPGRRGMGVGRLFFLQAWEPILVEISNQSIFLSGDVCDIFKCKNTMFLYLFEKSPYFFLPPTMSLYFHFSCILLFSIWTVIILQYCSFLLSKKC